ncbi:MAG: hypothetical protein IKL84_01260 [Clostridia bacterium]|nr:hypothetical protein [Clostridia bacterium]
MKQVRNHPLLATLIAAFGLHALRAFVICPLLVEFGTNILYVDSILPPLFDLLADLCEMAAIYICLTFILETIFQRGFVRAIPVMLAYVGGFVFGTAANLIMDLVVTGGVADYWLFIAFALSSIALQLLQLVLIVVIAQLLARGQRDTAQPTQLFPRGNRLQWAALCGAGITALFRIGGRVITDINYGAPESLGEIGFMVLGYGSDLLIPLLGYLGMVLLMMSGSGEVSAEKQAKVI